MADTSEEGAGGTYTQEQVEQMVKEKLAEAKASGDEAFQNLWHEAKKAKERAKAFEGLDPDEVRAKIARLTELEHEGKAKKVGMTDEQIKKLREDIRADLEKDYAPYKSQVEELRRHNRTLQLDNVVKKIMVENGVLGERVDALFRLTQDSFELTDDGKPMLKTHPGREVSKFVGEDLAKQYPEWFQGSGSSGGGASKSAAGGSGSVRRIQQGDADAWNAHLAEIASLKVAVTE